MDGYSVISLVTVLVTIFALWKVRKDKEYKYSLLDISGVILNFVLMLMIYPPLSVMTISFSLYRFATEPMTIFWEDAAIALGRLMPAVSVAGIGVSAVLRRKEKPVPGFVAQFAGAAWFAVTILFAKLSGSY